MKTIYKYTLPFDRGNIHRHNMPVGAEVLYVAWQHTSDAICIWALVDAHDDLFEPAELRTFEIVGTGHKVRDGLKYLGSTQSDAYVWHVFEDVD